MIFLAFRPFIDSIQAFGGNPSEYWLWFLVPLVIAISIVYKGTKVALPRLPRAAALMSLQIFAVMILGGVGLYAGVWLVTRYGG